MAVGDVKSGLFSVSGQGVLNIQPPSSEEWVIHNIYHESSIELYFSSGANDLLFDSDAGNGVYAKYAFHVTNHNFIKVKNTCDSTYLIGYDGIQTK